MFQPTESLRQKMEAIRELKQEHLIGSQNAFLYMKVMRQYEELCEQIRKNPAITYNPSVKEMSFLCHNIAICAQYWLSLMSIDFSTVEHPGLRVYHYVETLISRTVPNYEDHLWQLDMPMILEKLLADIEELPDKRYMMNDFFIPEAGEMKCFIVKETGRRLNGKEIMGEPENFLCMNRKELSFEATAKIMLDEALIDLDEALIDEDLRIDLQRAYDANDERECHHVLQKCAVRENYYDIARWIARQDFGSVLHPIAEELKYLVSFSKIYERAGRELTLGYLEVERKTAIALVYDFLSKGSQFSDISELIGKSIDYFERNIRDRLSRFNRFCELGAPHVLQENEERLIYQARYFYLCLYQNRRWLERYFSS